MYTSTSIHIEKLNKIHSFRLHINELWLTICLLIYYTQILNKKSVFQYRDHTIYIFYCIKFMLQNIALVGQYVGLLHFSNNV